MALGRLPHRRFGRAAPATDAQAVDRAIRDADAKKFHDRPMQALSGGERARILLARAFAVESEWLLADQSVAALDPAHQLGVMARLAEAARRGMGLVVVLHDLTLATRFCDHLLLKAEERLIGDGRPDDVPTDEAAAAAYGMTRAEDEAFVAPWPLVTTNA